MINRGGSRPAGGTLPRPVVLLLAVSARTEVGELCRLTRHLQRRSLTCPQPSGGCDRAEPAAASMSAHLGQGRPAWHDHALPCSRGQSPSAGGRHIPAVQPAHACHASATATCSLQSSMPQALCSTADTAWRPLLCITSHGMHDTHHYTPLTLLRY